MIETDIDREKRLRCAMTSGGSQVIATDDLVWLLDRCERLRETVAMLSRSRNNRGIQFGDSGTQINRF